MQTQGLTRGELQTPYLQRDQLGLELEALPEATQGIGLDLCGPHLSTLLPEPYYHSWAVGISLCILSLPLSP